jgi:hypothetical protein
LLSHIADINREGRTRVPFDQYSDTKAMKGNGTPMSALKRVGNGSNERLKDWLS